MNEKRVDISVVVPVYNGATSIEELCRRTFATFTSIGMSGEIILVDDGSKDRTWDTIKKIKDDNPEKIVAIKLKKNYGQQNATVCGIDNTIGKLIVTIDDDLEYPPELIEKMLLLRNKKDADLIYATYKNKRQSLIRLFLTKVYKKINVSSNNKTYVESSFRLFDANLGKQISKHQAAFSYIDEFMSWYTEKIDMVTFNIAKGDQKNTRYRIKDLFQIYKLLLLFNPNKSLRLVSNIGAIMIFINFIWGMIIISRKIFLSINVQGYASIIVAILFSTGLIIFSLGIIAENLGKILILKYDKPSFIIETKL